MPTLHIQRDKLLITTYKYDMDHTNGQRENYTFMDTYIDISLTFPLKLFKFPACILKIQTEGSLSQNFDLGPSFSFMKCREKYFDYF